MDQQLVQLVTNANMWFMRKRGIKRWRHLLGDLAVATESRRRWLRAGITEGDGQLGVWPSVEHNGRMEGGCVRCGNMEGHGPATWRATTAPVVWEEEGS
uniref:Uncharacterized protein n=1 Tax=Oryza brachyantha TaxID=4533 RepID=J3LM07_ORYBR